MRILPFPRGGDVAAPSLSQYRGVVVELPWPDFLGRRILLAIDWRGQVFDQAVAASEAEAQRITDRLTDELERMRERQQELRVMFSGDASPSDESSSTAGE